MADADGRSAIARRSSARAGQRHSPGGEAGGGRRRGADSGTSSVQTVNLTSWLRLKIVVKAASTASRPAGHQHAADPGVLCRASNVYQRPSR